MRLVLECTVRHEIEVDPSEAASIIADAKTYGAGSTEVGERFYGTNGKYQDAALLVGPIGHEEPAE